MDKKVTISMWINFNVLKLLIKSDLSVFYEIIALIVLPEVVSLMDFVV